MNGIAGLLPFIKIIGTFILILTCIRLKLGLWLSVLTGALSIALFFGLGMGEWVEVGISALGKEKFLFLVSIVGLILIISDGLERSGQSQRLTDALSGYLHDSRLRLIFFPALIGLLPMPGGAVFSAPMVKAVSADMPIKDIDRAIINYWFRHVWELAWPLYPGIILTVALAEIPLSAFISKSWPGVVAMFLFGWLFLLRPATRGKYFAENTSDVTKERNAKKVLKEATPLLIAIVGAIGLESILARFAHNIPFEWGVITALFIAAISVMAQNNLRGDYLIKILMKKNLWSMLAVIAAIFIFKDTMQAAGVVEAMAEASGEKAALFAAAILLPFLVGMVSGINVAFVGATFPLLLGLLDIMHLQHQSVAYLILATFSGFTGVMISPIHICFMLTCEYFATDLFTTWKRLVLPSAGCALTGIGLFFILI